MTTITRKTSNNTQNTSNDIFTRTTTMLQFNTEKWNISIPTWTISLSEQYSKVIEQYHAWTIAQGFLKDILWHRENNIQGYWTIFSDEQYCSKYRSNWILFIGCKSNDILRWTILLKILFDSYIVRLVHPMNNIQRLLNNITHEQ